MQTKFVVWAFTLFATLIGVNWAFSLLSAKSDIQVLLGFALIVVIVALWLPRGRKAAARGLEYLKEYLSVALIITAVGMMGGCTRIEPGHVGIVVNQMGSEKGVQDYTAQTGVIWYNPATQDVLEYPTFVQTAVWTHNTQEGSPNNEEIIFSDKDGLAIAIDLSISWYLDAAKVPSFYVKFRSDDLETFTHGFLRNVARDHFNDVGPLYGAEQHMGVKREEFMLAVRKRVNDQLAQYGVVIEQFGVIGAPRPPEAVTTALNAKVKATQDAIRVENELRQETAEAQKAVAKANGTAAARLLNAKAEAEANLLVAKSITPELIQWRAIEKWNGARPMVEGVGSGMILQIPPLSAPAAK
ncbi:MAG: prohibitin family protein [Patescibacteria group bacterium]